MQQALFVRQNEEKWKSFEAKLKRVAKLDVDQLTAIYNELSEDYAFAKAKYPQSQLTAYLSEQVLKAHNYIYSNKPERAKRLIHFWKYEIPEVLRETRKEQLYAFAMLMVGVLIGYLSGANDGGFARIILGDSYVDMTLANIAKGDPLAVYKGHAQTDMFFMITFNNIRVSFLAFAMGILFSVGTGYILFSNGVMLGVFHQFLFSEGVPPGLVLSVWVHGTLEISAIVIAGAAGLTMGNALLFPGSYPRIHSLTAGAKKGLKIIVSLVPFFVVAGFIESVITRNTHWPLYLKLIIVGVSLFIVVYYLFLYPQLHRYATKH